jgi:hypothetical protein
MTNIQCMKCKRKTSTVGEQNTTDKNGKSRIIGNCSVCGSKKSMYVGKKKGQAVYLRPYR